MPNITATERGRDLVLTVEGIADEFVVHPLPARRGRYLTEQFIRASLGQSSAQSSEALFVESLGPALYSLLAGLYVDEYDTAGEYVATHSPTAQIVAEGLRGSVCTPTDLRYGTRDPIEGEPELNPPALRQEEVEALALAAFYWQTVVGMEAVTRFVEAGGGQAGSLKALSLLQIRLGLSNPRGSLPTGTGSPTQQVDLGAMNDTENSFASVPPPANRQARRAAMFGRRRN